MLAFLKPGCCAALQWFGWIKDYDGGTLMECVLFPRLPYTELPVVVRAQREALDAKIRGFSNSHIVHPGLQHFADGQRQRLHIASIPGACQAGGLNCRMAHRSPLQQCVGTGQVLSGHLCTHAEVLA